MSSPVIRLICPNLKCRSILITPAEARGKAVRCSKCGVKVHVPVGSSAPTPAPAGDMTH